MGCLNVSGDLELTGTLVAKIEEPARSTKHEEGMDRVQPDGPRQRRGHPLGRAVAGIRG